MIIKVYLQLLEVKSQFKKTKKTRQHCDSFLTIAFTWCVDKAQPILNCLVGNAKPSNEFTVPSKLNRYFSKKHVLWSPL